MPVYFINNDDIVGETIRIGPPLSHHLIRVLRYQKGDILTLADADFPQRYRAKITTVSSTNLRLEILQHEWGPAPRGPLLRMGMALIKGDGMDWAIQKATELGASRISPLITRYVVAKPRADRVEHQQRRWREIAKEAAQQCERWAIPQVDPPQPLEAFLPETADFQLIFWEKAPVTPLSPPIQSALNRSPKTGTLLIGPEGGWAEEEVDRAKQCGYLPVSLGERLLRADTAALTALSIVQYEIQNRQG